jgi:hypothetical protein
MNYKKLFLILTITATMCACKDNATTEPEQKTKCETCPEDTTFIGDTMKITYKDWVTLDWSSFDSAWAVNDSLRNAEFTELYIVYYDSENKEHKYYYTTKIKGDSAKIKKCLMIFGNSIKNLFILNIEKTAITFGNGILIPL